MAYVAWFGAIGKDDIAAVGGKGAHLGELSRAGFPVPPGFVLTMTFFAPWLEYIQETPAWTKVLDSLDCAPEELRRNCQAVKRVAMGLELDDLRRWELAAALQSLQTDAGASLFAVRSSSPEEDLEGASFAGEYVTTLGVRQEDIEDAVRRSFTSCLDERVLLYKREHGFAVDTPRIAVIVQQQIAAATAGVAFSLNPLNNCYDEAVINANFGLGESVVAGLVTPDSFTVDKVSRTVLERNVGSKETSVWLAPDGGTRTVNEGYPPARARPCLSDAEVLALTDMLVEVEDHYGKPVDIEWAFADGASSQKELYLLQARPITALPPADRERAVPGDDDWPVMDERQPQPFDLWTQSNVGEVWPHPVSPLLWSAVTLSLNCSSRFFLRDLRASYLDEIQWARRFYGRVYYNEGALAHILHQEFGLPGSFIDAAFGSRRRTDLRHPGGFHLLRALRRLPLFLRITVGRIGTDRELEALFPQIDGWVADFAAQDLDEFSDRELWEELRTVWVPRSTRAINLHTAVSGSALATFSLLERLLDRWTGRGELAQDLVTGLSGVYTAEIGVALWRMACKLRDLGLADVVLDHPPETALAKLQATPAAQPVLEELDAFLQRYGHRCPNEGEWLNPRWAEAPAQVMEMVAGYLKAGDQINPVEAEARQRRRREEAVTWVEARLDPVRRTVFRGILARTQHLTRLRDNGKHYFMKTAFPFIRTYRTLGRRWMERGRLRRPDDIFFMAVPDVERIMEAWNPAAADLDPAGLSPSGQSLHTLVAARRKAYEHWFNVKAPEVIGHDGRPLDSAQDGRIPGPRTVSVRPAEATLQGIAASGGQAHGPARVIRSPQEMGRLRRGDILVTRATDPGWTPVFPIVGGLVLEVGGQLSHGAIVAREYGVPAVVNVHNAMQRIMDGQTVTVDGTAGRVYIEISKEDTDEA